MFVIQQSMAKYRWTQQGDAEKKKNDGDGRKKSPKVEIDKVFK